MIQAVNDISVSLPKISIITIVRNGMPFIKQTIESVIGQSYPNVEYVVIDSVSTDGTVDIIKYFDSGITKWVSEKDKGIADAFNKGLSFATGDYLLFLNSDDAFSDTNVLLRMAEKIVENIFPSLIYGDCNILDRTTDEVLYRAVIKVSSEGLKRGHVLPHPSLLTNRSYFEKYGSFDQQFKIAMDYEWLLRGGLREKIVYVPLLITNVRNGGVSTVDQKKVVNEIILALKKNGHIQSAWDELKMRTYFSSRSLAKAMLKMLKIYKIFTDLRNKQAVLSHKELK
jgi:glycosyltransferase involved in cell wall biosynthesis